MEGIHVYELAAVKHFDAEHAIAVEGAALEGGDDAKA